MSNYYIKINQEEKGPYTGGQLRSMWDTGAITSDTLFRLDGSEHWNQITELFDVQKVESATVPAAVPKKSSANAVGVLVLFLIIAAIVLGNFHVITSRHLDMPRIVKKESFGMSETFINVDTVTGMPWIAAQTRYPLSCVVLRREGLIESEEEFKIRQEKDIEKALKGLR